MKSVIATLLCLLPLKNATAAEAILNGDFSNGLSNWQTSGNVFTTSGLVVLGDNGVTRSILQQTTTTSGLNLCLLSLDVRNILSIDPGSGFLDTAFFSLYFTNTPGSLDVVNNSGYTSLLPLFDMDSNGFSNIATGGSFGTSPLGPNYKRFTLTFSLPTTHLAPVVDLYDLNFIDNDSLLVMDNFSLQAIPESGSVGLAGVGFALILFKRRRCTEPSNLIRLMGM